MNWLKEVADASTHEALLDLVNQFLLEHPEDFWSWVPKSSRPTLVASIDEVHRWHRKLADDLASATMPNVRMQDVCVFFVRASARAMELEQKAKGRDEPSNDGNGASPRRNGGSEA